ncbi:MAG TPA: NAD-dependent epimerase/dehydratase family protein [Acidimicrobiales bacterium]
MRVLVIGGTVFLGRHVVDLALERGDDVTIFHRGRHPSHRPGDVEEVLGDRDVPGDLGALAGRSWDAVVDTSAYRPRQVTTAVEAVGAGAGHWSFVSSISVYAEGVAAPVDETSAVRPPPADGDAAPLPEAYGELKLACELALAGLLPRRGLSVRAGLIVGPEDPSDRFTWWVRLLDEGGEVLAPAVPDQPVQVVDVRDLAAFLLDAAAAGAAGVVNGVGPAEATLADLLAGADVTWVDEAWLLDQGVEPWTDVPLWVPSDDPEAGLLHCDDTRARALGLRARPLAATVADTAAWDRGRDRSAPLRAGLPPERVAELLAAWRARA